MTDAIANARLLSRRSCDSNSMIIRRQTTTAYENTQKAMKYSTASQSKVNIKNTLRLLLRRPTSSLMLSISSVVELLFLAADDIFEARVAISAPLSKTGTCCKANAAAVQENAHWMADTAPTRTAIHFVT